MATCPPFNFLLSSVTSLGLCRDNKMFPPSGFQRLFQLHHSSVPSAPPPCCHYSRKLHLVEPRITILILKLNFPAIHQPAPRLHLTPMSALPLLFHCYRCLALPHSLPEVKVSTFNYFMALLISNLTLSRPLPFSQIINQFLSPDTAYRLN